MFSIAILNDRLMIFLKQAFQDAWKMLCAAKGENGPAFLVIHASETYTIRPQLFQGPCASRNLHIQVFY